MKLSWIIKVNFLILNLGLVIYLIVYMKSSGLPTTLQAILGISNPSTIDLPSHTRQLTWCETRIKSMETKNFRIYQDKLKWFLSSTSSQKIDDLFMEKWFVKNCSLQIEPMQDKNAVNYKDPQTALVVTFIKGTAERLLMLEPDVYSWKGQVFRSPQVSSALSQLEQCYEKSNK